MEPPPPTLLASSSTIASCSSDTSVITDRMAMLDVPQAIHFPSKIGMVNHKSGCSFQKKKKKKKKKCSRVKSAVLHLEPPLPNPRSATGVCTLTWGMGVSLLQVTFDVCHV